MKKETPSGDPSIFEVLYGIFQEGLAAPTVALFSRKPLQEIKNQFVKQTLIWDFKVSFSNWSNWNWIIDARKQTLQSSGQINGKASFKG